MIGPDSDPGLAVRALTALFGLAAAEGAERTAISVSMSEIYNDSVRDLLNPAAAAAGAPKSSLEVSGMGPGQLPPGQERVPGLTWRAVSGVADVLAVLAEGTAGRATAATALNTHSSRSHALLSVRLADAAGALPPSTLHLVDLAGGRTIGLGLTVAGGLFGWPGLAALGWLGGGPVGKEGTGGAPNQMIGH